MAKETTQINWKYIINLYSSHEDKMADFWEAKNITRNQLYYHRSRQIKKNSISFHPVKLKSKDSLDTSNKKSSTDISTIKISIGKAGIHIPTSEKSLLIDSFKAFM